MPQESPQIASKYASFWIHPRFRKPRVGRLSILPAELLQMIFEQVRLATRKQMRGAISKRLAPFTEANLYYSAYLYDFEGVKLLARTLVPASRFERRPLNHRRHHLASLVRHIQVDLGDDEELEEGWKSFCALDLFKALKNLAEASIQYCPPLVDLFTSPCTVTNMASTLTAIKIEGVAEETDNPYLIGRFQHLGLIPRLEKLELKYWTTDNNHHYLPPATDLSTGHQIALGITTLDIGIELPNTSNEELATFLSFFPDLQSLTFEDHTSELSFDIILSKMSPKLLHLSISQDGATFDPQEFGNVFPRFLRLQSLKLLYDASNDVTILAVQTLPSIETLCLFLYRIEMETVLALEELLHRNRRTASLVNLRIDGLRGKEGDRFDHLLDAPSGPHKVDWSAPMCHKLDVFDEMKVFLAAASKIGVTVTGDIWETMRVQERWNEQVAMIEGRKQLGMAVQAEAEALAQEWRGGGK